MNLVILDPEPGSALDAALRAGQTVEVALAERQAAHLSSVLRAKPEQRVRVGLVDGPRGDGRVVALSAKVGRLEVTLDASDWPRRPPFDLLLAVPRPLQLSRSVQHAAALGVDRLVLLRTWAVDPNYLASRRVDAGALREDALLGLEQSGQTWLPRIEVAPAFRAFTEDRLPALLGDPQADLRARFVATPGAPALAARFASEPALRAALQGGRAIAAIGPERGFTPHEVERLEAHGFAAVGLGDRVLRVETALPALLAQIEVLQGLARIEA